MPHTTQYSINFLTHTAPIGLYSFYIILFLPCIFFFVLPSSGLYYFRAFFVYSLYLFSSNLLHTSIIFRTFAPAIKHTPLWLLRLLN